MTPAVEVRGISKQYRRGRQHHGTQLLTRALWRWARGGIGRGPDRAQHGDSEPFWALHDVSFSIEPGEVVGIIGRNGSGKSTVLKIIAQITAPTTGEVRLNGRAGTLLEVGTGFHPELSGRENVFLNGAILGMSRVEIARKFDEIVAFSGIEAFIDTPVKRYSSGMQTRLAFSVAAHLEPEILIVDEVLAVGDADFQKKCLGKMNEVSKAGRTVLFVSHNMSAVDRLCNRIIWLDRGQLVDDSRDKVAVTSRYLFGNAKDVVNGEITASDVPPVDNEFFTFRSFRVRDRHGKTIDGPVAANEEVSVEIGLHIKKLNQAFLAGYVVSNEEGEVVYWAQTTDASDGFNAGLRTGDVILSTRIPPRFLNQGLYRLDFIAGVHHLHWLVAPDAQQHAIFLRVEGGVSDSAYWLGRRPGVVAPVLPWQVEPQSTFAALSGSF
ncbi:MAG: polysaccharide ABC transporter ATP-binding protein [Xanthobacteraceae bacterium]|nr:polysaccharide ABC transporter ATP-binding protein [Xanthobacteraceae bacterium]